MVSCPNRNSKEWIKLVDELGETNAYKVFLANNEEVPEMSVILNNILLRKKEDTKEEFIARMNSRIENGMYKRRDGILEPVTDESNPEVWWIENTEKLTSFINNDKVYTKFNFKQLQKKLAELNSKYRSEGFIFKYDSADSRISSKAVTKNSMKIWKIMPVKAYDLSREISISEDDIANQTKENVETVSNTFDQLENKTSKEILDILLNLEISDNYKQILNFLLDHLLYNPNLKIVINKEGTDKLADYDPSTNIITLYSKAHLDRQLVSLDEIANSLTHELVHSFTIRALRFNQTLQEKEFRTTMTRLYEIAKKRTKFKDHSAYSSVEEFTSYVLTDPKIMEEAKQMSLNIWERLLLAVKKLFGMSSVYDRALEATIGYIGNNTNFRVTDKSIAGIRFKRSLEEDVFLNVDNVTHKQIWDTLNMFSNDIDFNESEHIYTLIKDNQNIELQALTDFMQRARISSGVLSSKPEVKEKTLKNRKRGADIGNIIHKITESDIKNIAIKIAEDNGFKYDNKVVTKLQEILKVFKRPGVTILSEVIVADLDRKLAGTIDLIIIDENNQLHIYDFKTKERGFATLLEPTSFGGSITMSDKDRFAFQLSGYKDMLEKMTGLKVATMNIVALKPVIDGNTIQDIYLDKTHSSNGIISIDYNSSVYAMYRVLDAQSSDNNSLFNSNKVDSETNKQIDDELRGKASAFAAAREVLTDKERVLLSSIEALAYKLQVLHRSGRRTEIESQEGLIAKLIDELDSNQIDMALLRLTKYANSSALRIINEYNSYKDSGKELPLTILYAWRDSMAAYDSILNDEYGLNAILDNKDNTKETKELKAILKDTMSNVSKVKGLYEKEGISKLVDFLSPFYHGIYAKKKEEKVKEYRRKKFKGEIGLNITEKEYVEKYLNEHEEDIQEETRSLMRKELIKASRDIGVLTRWIDNLLDSSDPVTAAMVKAFVFADERSRLEKLEKRDEFVAHVRRLEDWYRKTGRIPRSNEEFYDFMLERDDSGNLTGHYITRHKSSMVDEYRNIVRSSREFKDPVQRKEWIKAWKDINMPLDSSSFKIGYWEFIAELEKDGKITAEEISNLEDNYKYNRLSNSRLVEIGSITFETGELINKWLTENTWSFRNPIDKWVNPQYAELEKILEDKNDPRGDFYNFIVKMNHEADSYLPFGFRLDSRLPGVIKQAYERIDSGQSIGSTIRGALSKEFTFRIDDTHRVHEELEDESGNAKYFLPIHFTGRVTKKITKLNKEGEEYEVSVFDEAEQSFDVANLYYKYWGMANDYNHKSAILPEMELAKFMINKRRAIKTDSSGMPIFKKVKSRVTGNVDSDTERRISNTQLAQQVNDWFLMCVYGIQEKDAGKTGSIDRGKFLNFINSYVSLNLLGMNFVAGTANLILGETLQRIETFASEYMSPKDFMYGDVYYLRAMKGIIGDIGARDTQGLGSHLIEWGGVLDNYGDTYMDRRTKMGQLMKMDTLYFTSRLGEHYMQGRFLFGMLANKRAFNSKGEDIGRMLDMYYLDENNKLQLKDTVNLDKSKWNENDQLEFKVKVRGILSRLHGEYASLGNVAIQRMALGRMAYLFRHFIVPGWRRRWGGEQYIERLGQYVEGNYITTLNFLGVTGSKIFGKNDNNREMLFFQRLIDNLQSFKLSMWSQEWATLSDHEKANIHRTLYEVGFLILAVVMANIAMSLKEGGDDDELDEKFWSFIAYQMYRFQNEMMFFTPKLDSAMSILRSPAASISFVENIIDLSGQIFHPNDLYESGPWKGKRKISKTLLDMSPGVRQIYRLKEMESQVGFVQKASLSGERKKDDEEDL